MFTLYNDINININIVRMNILLAIDIYQWIFNSTLYSHYYSIGYIDNIYIYIYI